MEPSLVRNEDEKMIAGVCSGLADYLAVDPVLVRLAFLLLIPAGGVGIPLYIILMIIMPSASEAPPTRPEKPAGNSTRPALAAVLLILLGCYFLMQSLGWTSSGLFWPSLLILLGVWLLLRRQ